MIAEPVRQMLDADSSSEGLGITVLSAAAATPWPA